MEVRLSMDIIAWCGRAHGAGAHPHTHKALCSLIPSFHDITTNDVPKKRIGRIGDIQ